MFRVGFHIDGTLFQPDVVVAREIKGLDAGIYFCDDPQEFRPLALVRCIVHVIAGEDDDIGAEPVYCFDGFCEGAGFIGHVAVVGIEPHLGVRNLHDDRDRRFFPCGCECGRQTAKSC